ncbi:MAG: hypothetical protein ACOC3X_02635 [Nanoarchaeota archaeon]
MATLITCLSTGKGTWIKVMDLINLQDWDNIFIICNQFAKEKFKVAKKAEFIVINEDDEINKISNTIKDALNKKIDDFEIALNIDSGSGKEHMALISSILKLGLSLRFVCVEKGKLIEITPYEK